MCRKLKTSNSNEVFKITFKRYRNFCNNLLKNLNKQYEKDVLIKTKSNIKKLWSAIKETTYTGKTYCNALDLLKLRNSPNISVNEVNTFFSNMCKTLANSVSSTSSHDKVINIENVCNSMFLKNNRGARIRTDD